MSTLAENIRRCFLCHSACIYIVDSIRVVEQTIKVMSIVCLQNVLDSFHTKNIRQNFETLNDCLALDFFCIQSNTIALKINQVFNESVESFLLRTHFGSLITLSW